MKKTIIVVFTIFALMGMVDLVDASRGTIYAEAATRKAAKKTSKKSVAKKATTTKVASLDARSEMSKLIKGQYLEQYSCWKGSLTTTVRVSDEVTVIVTKTGKTANTGVTLKKGTAVKVFVKKAAQQSTSQVTTSQKDRQEVANEIPTSRKGVVVLNNRYALEFKSLVPFQGKAVDGAMITCEEELALIGRNFTRDTRVTGRFSVKLERALLVRESAMDVIAYPAKGGARDVRDGETVKKGTVVTIWLKSQKVATFAPVATAPVESVSDVNAMQALTAEQQLAQRTATYAPVTVAQPQTQPAASENPEFEEFKEAKGFALSPTGLWGDFRIVREEFVVSDTTVVRQRMANGKWRTLEPGTRVTAGWQNVRVFANAVNTAQGK